MFNSTEKRILEKKWTLNDVEKEIEAPLSGREVCKLINMNYMDYDMGAYEGTHKKIIRYLKSEKGRDYAEWIKAFDVNI